MALLVSVGGAVAQEAPAEITALELSTSEESPVLTVRADRELEWGQAFDADGALVLTFPGSVPGPAVGSISRSRGLLAAIEVGFAVPGGRPTTTLRVIGRAVFELETRPVSDGVEVAFRSEADPDRQILAPDTVETTAPAASEPALERRLGETEAADRRLAEELATAREELAAATAETDRLEAERLGLLSEVEEARSESASLRAQVEQGSRVGAESLDRSREESAALRAALDAAREEVQAREKRLEQVMAEGETLRSRVARLEEKARAEEQTSGEAEAARTAAEERAASLEAELAALRDEASVLRRDLTAARQRAASGERAGANAATRVAELESRLAELVRANESLRREYEVLDERSDARDAATRSLLTQAPRILGASEFFVADGVSPCLNLRASPSRSGQVVDCLAPASRFSVVNLSDGWLRVRLDDAREGWVATDFVEPSSSRELAALRRERDEAVASLQRAIRDRDEGASRLVELEGLEERLRVAEEALSRSEAAQLQLDDARRSAEQREVALAAELAALRSEREQEALRQAGEGGERERLAAQLAAERRTRAELEARAADLEGRIGALTLEGGAEREAARRRLGAAAEALGAAVVQVGATVTPCLRLRPEPVAEGTSLDCLEPGRRARVLDFRPGWFEIGLEEGGRGWAAADYLESAASAELAAAATRERELKDQLATLEARRLEEVAAADRRAVAAETAAAASDSARAQLEERLVGTETEQAELEGRIVELESELVRRREASTGDLAAAESRAASLDSERQDLVARIETLTAERDEARRSFAAAETAVAEAAANRTDLESRFAELEEARRRQADEGARALAQRDDLARRLEEAVLERSNAVAELESARAAAFTEPPPDHEAELSQALATVAALERHRDELELELATVAGERDELLARSADAAPDTVDAEALVVSDLPRDELQDGGLASSEAMSADPVTADLPAEGDLVALVEAWAAAWSEQRVDDYLFFYADAFAPVSGASRGEWKTTRRRRLSRPSFIDVGLAGFEIQIDGPSLARVSFEQSYRSDTYQDRVRKSLKLVREDGLWKILEETSF